jgi:hypothetical protein
MSALGCESPLYEDKHHQNWRGFARRRDMYLVYRGARADDHHRDYDEGGIHRVCSRVGDNGRANRSELGPVALRGNQTDDDC